MKFTSVYHRVRLRLFIHQNCICIYPCNMDFRFMYDVTIASFRLLWEWTPKSVRELANQLLFGITFCGGMFLLMQYVAYREIPEVVKFNEISGVNRIIREFVLFDIKPTILCQAAKYGQIGVLKHLIELGVDLNASNGCVYRFAEENRQESFIQYLNHI